MEKGQFHVMGDPALDLIFTEAYRNTLKKVEKRERDKELRDHVEAMTELFVQELFSRDLTPVERAEFTRAFRKQIEQAEQDLAERRSERRRLRRTGLIIFFSLVMLSGIVYIARNKPFTPVSRIKAQLSEHFASVESGLGGHAQDYFRILDTYRHKLGDRRVAELEESMYRELDEQFEVLLSRVESGEVAYFDDARKWAGYFPDKEDRKMRRERVDNAVAQWIGRRVDESVDKVLEGAKELLDKVTE